MKHSGSCITIIPGSNQDVIGIIRMNCKGSHCWVRQTVTEACPDGRSRSFCTPKSATAGANIHIVIVGNSLNVDRANAPVDVGLAVTADVPFRAGGNPSCILYP